MRLGEHPYCAFAGKDPWIGKVPGLAEAESAIKQLEGLIIYQRHDRAMPTAIVILFDEDMQCSIHIAPAEGVGQKLQRWFFRQPCHRTADATGGNNGVNGLNNQSTSPDILSPGHCHGYPIVLEKQTL